MLRNTCQLHPDGLFNLEKLDQHKWMEFWKFKRFYWGKRKDCFLKIKQSLRRHTMLLFPNVSHYHSEYFCLRFTAVQVCFPSIISLSNKPLLIWNLENINSPQTFEGSCYIMLQILLSNGIQFLLVFNLNPFVLYSKIMHFYFHAFLYSC